MSPKNRIAALRLIQKLEQNTEYAKKTGINYGIKDIKSAKVKKQGVKKMKSDNIVKATKTGSHKKLIAAIVSFCILANNAGICSFADSSENADTPFISHDETINVEVLDLTGYNAASKTIVDNMLEQYKFRIPKGGHGFAAERGNNLIDSIKGNNAKVIGDNNVKDGADRIILNRDGTTVLIQDKYYNSANASIDACFNEEGVFRYLDGDSNPMQIEVPKDQYEKAVELMRKKITDGKVPGITDPNDAENIVREGHYTYKQAVNLAKAGTIESLKYDAANGIVVSTCAFGISAVFVFSSQMINGAEFDEALDIAVKEAAKTSVMVFGTSVIAGQLSKTRIVDVFKPSSEKLVAVFGEKFSRALLRTGEAETVAASGKVLTENAAKVLREGVLGNTVALVVFSIPDGIDLFQGRISMRDFIKNTSVLIAGLVSSYGGGIACSAIGTAIAPGVGTTICGVIGSVGCGFLGSLATEIVADWIVDEDDASEMYEIIQDSFAQDCEDYLVTESEAEDIVSSLENVIDEDFLKDMYQSDDREEFVQDELIPLFEETLENRETIEMPTESEMRDSLKAQYKGVVFIH